MDKKGNRSEQRGIKALSNKRILYLVLIAVIISFILLFTYPHSIKFLCESQNTTEPKQGESINTTQPNSEDNPEDDIICDFRKIKDEISKDNYRVHRIYLTILDGNPTTQKSYTVCKETLLTTVKEVLSKEKDIKFVVEDIDWINGLIDKGYIEYLIDDSFVVYGLNPEGRILKVDIINQSVELLWSTEEPTMTSVGSMYVIYEEDRSIMFFYPDIYGLGGTEEDMEVWENTIDVWCLNNRLGTFMYDTTTEEVTMVAKAEECL